MSALAGEALEQARAEAQAQIRALRERKPSLDDDSIDVILRGARSHYAWQDKPVSDEILETVYEITAAGATSMNCCVMSAPVTAIIAYDLDFWEQLPYLFPHEDRRPFFKGKTAYIEDTAFRNSTLQGAYFTIAARAVGLDVGALSGFSNEIVDQEFFADQNWKSNFLCNIGYADETALFQKLPRFPFNEVCSYL